MWFITIKEGCHIYIWVDGFKLYAPEQTGETIDNTMDADDRDVQLDLQKKKKKKMTSAQVIAKQKEWLVVHRNEMLSRYSNPTVSPTVHHDTSKWRQIAHNAWGNLVALASKGSKMFDWEEYVLSRTSTPSSCAKSYGLLQEQYQDCPGSCWWRVCWCRESAVSPWNWRQSMYPNYDSYSNL